MRRIDSGNMNSARIATVTAVTFIVGFAPLLCGLAEVKEPDTGDCSKEDSKGAQVVDVDTPETTVTLNCGDANKDKVNPKFEIANFQVCTDKDCRQQQPLSTYIEGATVEEVKEALAKVKIENLPHEAKTFYVQCTDAGEAACYIQVNVAEAPSNSEVGGNGQPGVPGGDTGSTGGVTNGRPLSCATPGEAITIKIPQKGSTAQFTCGDLTLYPRASDRVFAGDCKKEESLKDIIRSAKVDVYTLTADKKPPKKKWCYLCARSTVTSERPGQASDYCLVHVESSSRTQSSSHIALSAMLPCVLAMLRIT